MLTNRVLTNRIHIHRIVAGGLLYCWIALAAVVMVGCQERSATPAAGLDRLVRLRNLGMAYLEVGLTTEAAGTFKELTDAAPREPMGWYNRALIALRSNKLDAAGEFLDRAQQLAGKRADIFELAGAIAAADGRQTEAAGFLSQAIALAPEDVRLRYSLFELLRYTPEPEQRAGAGKQLEALLALRPDNLELRLAAVRAALDHEDVNAAVPHVNVVSVMDIEWPTEPIDTRLLVDQLQAAVVAGDAAAALLPSRQLRNVLSHGVAFRDAHRELAGPAGQPGRPLWNFLSVDIGAPSEAPPIEARFVELDERRVPPVHGATLVRVIDRDSDRTPWLAVATSDGIHVFRRLPGGDPQRIQQLPLGSAATSELVVCDYNNDAIADLVAGGSDGAVRLLPAAAPFLANEMTESSPGDGMRTLASPFPAGAFTVRDILPFDVDQDGDLDLLVAGVGERMFVYRNNGDGTYAELGNEMGFGQRTDVIDVEFGDLDDDGDPDLITVGSDGQALVHRNHRSGKYVVDHATDPGRSLGALQGVADVEIVDLNNDGLLDIAYADTAGHCGVLLQLPGSVYEAREIGGSADTPADANVAVLLRALDYDNDGRMDLLVVQGRAATLWRNDGAGQFQDRSGDLPTLDADVVDVDFGDLDADGDLDLILTDATGRLHLWDNDGGNTNAWQRVELAAVRQGGQRNNSFGIGATIEVRSGLAFQTRVVRRPVTHIGLGSYGETDSLRIIWPNGTPQVVIQPVRNSAIVEVQRLKGSCPFLFAWNGERFDFVTDLLWRSPVGMKINAQQVAAVLTTEDYVKVAASQLQAVDGEYRLAVTANLWEAIIIDAIALICVDHPADTEIFVDERFAPGQAGPLEIHHVDRLRQPVSAVDHRGRNILDLITERDGQRWGGFTKTRYQGVTEDHFVELDLGNWVGDPTIKLIASGWVYPTDTSINIALSQGSGPYPKPLQVTVADGNSGWTTWMPNAGFPAGKLKTIVLDLTGAFASDDHRVRLSSSMEIYWDRIGFALGDAPGEVHTQRLLARTADLDYTGFPVMARRDELSPSIPDYDTRTHGAPWRDMIGFYTRFGDVKPLLREVDDRYVIMNAGDEIGLVFDAPPDPPDGWRRDFIAFSDGWVKDGDWNTAESMTIAPLPYHGMTRYPYPPDDAPPSLRADHPDWTEYHTRYVAPR